MKIKWNKDFKKVPIDKICFIAIYDRGIIRSIFGNELENCQPYVKTYIGKIKKQSFDDGSSTYIFYHLNHTGNLTSYFPLCIKFDYLDKQYYGFAKYNKKIAEAYMYLNFGKVFELPESEMWDGDISKLIVNGGKDE